MAPETTTYEPEPTELRIALWRRQAAICRKEKRPELERICLDTIAQLQAEGATGQESSDA